MSRTTWSLSEEVAERLESVAERKEHESVTQFIGRVSDELEGDSETSVTKCDVPSDVLTVDNIPDIADATASRTREEFENARF